MKSACTHCSSSDGLHTYPDGQEHCFVCGYHKHTDAPSGELRETKTTMQQTGFITAIKDRRISLEACKRYGVTCTTGTEGQIVSHSYPYINTKTGETTAAKKRVTKTKDFSWSGDRSDTGLFGQQVCRGSGKYITVTEGELDCLAVSEMFSNKFDIVSLKDGAASALKDIKANLEFLEGYDNIVLCFDNDKAGKEAVLAIRDLFSPNKLKVVDLREHKDAGDYLKHNAIQLFTSSWYNAKAYLPDGIVKVSETWDSVLVYRDTPSTPYPWVGLNDKLIGQRTKEIVVWAAETGIGKSQTMREIQHHLVKTTQDTVGCLMLEESVAKTTLGWMSFVAERPLHKELDTLTDEELRKYWEIVTEGDRFVLLDHNGWQNNMETLKARIRYMAKALGCRWIVLDHLHIALSSISGASGDWSGIDELMTDLVGLVHELDIGLHLVSHTSADRTLRGSKGISKLADAVIFLERDKHAEGEEADITTVIVDKNRFSGDMGVACYLKYDKFTGRMSEVANPVPDTTNGEF